jgi:hypothetical protein
MRIYVYKKLFSSLFPGALLFTLIFTGNAFSQQVNGISIINAYLDSLSKKLPPEKIYLQTDKSFYNLGDTLWLKGYLFDARFFIPSAKSGLVYAELIDGDNKIAKRMLFAADNGLFRGSIVLSKDELKAGPITLRAYTNWMRNWSTGNFFTKSFYLNNSGPPLATATDATTATNDNGGTNKVKTNRPPAKANFDLQFMPEGGHLVNGLTGTIGFKAINTTGKGINLSGKIYNNKEQEITQFRSIYAGMGYFVLTPAAGENYYAVVDSDPDKKHYALPKAEASGILMHVDNDPGGDVIKVTLTAAGINQPNPAYYLVAQSRGALCYGANLKFNAGKVDADLQKSKFPTGIVRLSLFDGRLQPVCERVVFVDHNDALNISLKTSADHKIRDSVALQIKVTNSAGKPVQGSFSLAVTDDGLVDADTTSNIRTSVLLSADLNGDIESPAYYFGNAANRHAALEALMLTQGWVNYKWNDLKVPAIQYQPQPEFTIAGRITNLFNKGVPDTKTDKNGYFSFRNIPPIDTGNFLLQALKNNGRSKNVGFKIASDEPAPLIRAKRGSEQGYDITADTTLMAVIKNNTTVKRKADEMLYGKNILQEVVITGKKIIKGSKNLNGPGNADDVVDENEMLKAAKTPLIAFLYQRIKGFHEGIFPLRANVLTAKPSQSGKAPTFTDKNLNVRKNSYIIKRHRVKFVFDGIDTEAFFQPADEIETPLERMLYLKGVLEQFSAEDVKGMEVMYSGTYNNIYNGNISSGYEQANFISPVNDLDYAYIEITTRSGKGPFINMKDGFYAYRPLMPSWSKEFYRPRYTATNIGSGVDFRSTLHWESNIVTDEQGGATVSFFTSDRPGTFTVITEGSNMNGLFGVGKGNFTVKKP